MCGIVGKIDFKGNEVDRTLIKKMADTIVYRGPDDEGIHTAPYIGLGQRRLSIIDLRKEATAPLSNEDKTIWVVFNGEIYNYQSLRAELLQKGHIFRTSTDTEVIVHLYEEYGEGCLKHMRGMFSFALWDSLNKKLFAARDRFGKKPFFYTRTPYCFLFGSEIKAIMADPCITKSPDFFALDCYLSYQYVPSPLSAFSGVYKLPPAHSLTCNADGVIKIERYWTVNGHKNRIADKHEIESELLALLRESVRLRMVSDVPIGAILSGGIDSATVVALMSMESDRPVKTFTIGFTDDDFNELPYAKVVSERYGTDHHEFIVHPNAIDILPLLVKHYNEPFADSSAIPTYYVSKITREHVTVALSGDGGDESFGGYNRYQTMLNWSRIDFIPLSIRKLLCSPIEKHLSAFGSNHWLWMAKALHMASGDLQERYRQFMCIVKDQEKPFLYTEKFKSLIGDNGENRAVWDLQIESTDGLDWMIRHDQRFYLPDCLMVKTDIASMANSLEVRCPLLDHKLAEFASTIPSSLKRNSSGGKVILKDAVKSLLPAETLKRRKSGFAVPLNLWFKNEWFWFLTGVLKDGTALKRNLFDRNYVNRIIEEHAAGTKDWSNRLWALLFLEMWFREFID